MTARESPAASPPAVVVARERRSAIGTAVQVVMLLLMLSILAAVLLVLVALGSLVNVPGQVAGGFGSRLSGVATEASRAVGGAQQALQNATDPNHPPGPLVQDTEFTALQVVHAGEHLAGGTEYTLSLQAVRRRDGANSPDSAQFAVIHAELRQPRETRILGQLVRSDSDAHDYAVYKGELFRIGQAVYRMNWLSESEAAAAAGVLRNPDVVTAPLKFDYP